MRPGDRKGCGQASSHTHGPRRWLCPVFLHPLLLPTGQDVQKRRDVPIDLASNMRRQKVASRDYSTSLITNLYQKGHPANPVLRVLRFKAQSKGSEVADEEVRAGGEGSKDDLLGGGILEPAREGQQEVEQHRVVGPGGVAGSKVRGEPIAPKFTPHFSSPNGRSFGL